MEKLNDVPAAASSEGEGTRYRVAWKVKETGATGHGEYTDEKTADAWVKSMNAEHPDMEHWLEPEEK